eukprot:9383279-Lingulodinium_polyedra.AAC.1
MRRTSWKLRAGAPAPKRGVWILSLRRARADRLSSQYMGARRPGTGLQVSIRSIWELAPNSPRA